METGDDEQVICSGSLNDPPLGLLQIARSPKENARYQRSRRRAQQVAAVVFECCKEKGDPVQGPTPPEVTEIFELLE